MINGKVYSKSGGIFNVKSNTEYSLMEGYINEEHICEFYLESNRKLYISHKNIDYIIIEDSPSN